MPNHDEHEHTGSEAGEPVQTREPRPDSRESDVPWLMIVIGLVLLVAIFSALESFGLINVITSDAEEIEQLRAEFQSALENKATKVELRQIEGAIWADNQKTIAARNDQTLFGYFYERDAVLQRDKADVSDIYGDGARGYAVPTYIAYIDFYMLQDSAGNLTPATDVKPDTVEGRIPIAMLAQAGGSVQTFVFKIDTLSSDSEGADKAIRIYYNLQDAASRAVFAQTAAPQVAPAAGTAQAAPTPAATAPAPQRKLKF